MSDMTHRQTNPAQPESEARTERKRANVLTFPSVAVMGTAVFVVVLMMVISGWKIVNLEQERARVDIDRRLLERDRLAYSKILEELPGLEDKRQVRIREVAELEGKVQSSRTVLESLTTQKDLARSELDRAKALEREAEEAAKAARDTFANLQGEIQTKRPELQSLEQKIAATSEEEKALRNKRDQLQKDIARLEADVAGLEQQKQNRKQVLEQMAQDTGVLQSLSTRFGKIADSLELSRKEANSAVDEWKNQAQSLNQAIGSIQKDTQNFSKQVQGVSSDSEILGNAVKGLPGTTKAAQKAAGDLQKANTSLSGAINQIQKDANKAIEGLTVQAHSLSQSIGMIQKNVQDFSGQIQVVISYSANFADTIKDAQSTFKTAQIAVEDLKTSNIGLSESISQIRKDSNKAIEGLTSQTQTLGTSLTTIQGAAQEFTEQVKIYDGNSANFADMVKGLQITVGAAQQAAVDLQTANTSLNGIISETHHASSGMDREVQNLLKSASGFVADLQNEISTFNKSVSELGKITNSLDTYIDSVKAKIGDIDGSALKFSETVVDIKETANDLSKTRTDLADLFSTVRDIASRVQNFEQTRKDIEEDVIQELPQREKSVDKE